MTYPSCLGKWQEGAWKGSEKFVLHTGDPTVTLGHLTSAIILAVNTSHGMVLINLGEGGSFLPVCFIFLKHLNGS